MNPSLLKNYLARSSTEEYRPDVAAYLAILDHLESAAPSVAAGIKGELHAQRSTLKLIASENYSSLSVQLAMGNLLTDKYCEGYPYHRFYAGCENVDKIELEAAQLAQKLFGMDHAYVQPHSGSDANLVAFWAILTQRVQEPQLEKWGNKTLDQLTDVDFETLRMQLCQQSFMGLGLSSGGHLTHGFRQNVSAKMMRAINYEVDPKTGRLNYDTIASIAREHKPLILLAGYSAYPRRINFAKMREIADEVGAVLMADCAHFAGLIVGKTFSDEEDPGQYAQILTTTTHKTLRGPRGGLVLCQKEFTDTVNKGCPLVLGGPLPHVIAAKLLAFQEAARAEFRVYAQQIIDNARALAQGLIKRGIKLVTGGTDNHIVLIDLTHLGITGRIAERALEQAKITASRNMIPFDKNGAWYTSGIRLGSAALTSLGMQMDQMDEVADLISKVLHNTTPERARKTGKWSKAYGKTDFSVLREVERRLQLLLCDFPLYPQLTI